MRSRSPVFLPALVALALTSGCLSAPDRRSPVPPPPDVQEPFAATLTVEADNVPVYAEASLSATVVASLRSGDRLGLIERRNEWLLVQDPSGARGYVEASSLVSPICTTDRAEPRIIEEPMFRFQDQPPDGRVVLAAEYTAEGRLLTTRVLENTVGDPSFEQLALEDLRKIRFLPPTTDCKPRPFFYIFTRQF